MRTLQIDGFKVCGCSNWRLCERFKLVYYASAGWSSLVARWAHNPKVAGSNPAPATIYKNLTTIRPLIAAEGRLFCFHGLALVPANAR